ncbi:ribosome-inactivating family protein [Streptomyces sp. NPDC001663]|uniref:ribosome-inactivating family protein n=1 Tax=Streptomyces sp. NPDC001663 TaxID=3364597 RepID=UPI003695885A
MTTSLLLPAALVGAVALPALHSGSSGTGEHTTSLGQIQTVGAQTITDNISANFDTPDPRRWADICPENPVGAGSVRDDFIRQGDYTYLERQGHFERSNQQLGMGLLDGAITTLSQRSALGSVPITQLAAQSQAITAVIQMIAEGARFDFMSANIGEHARNGQTFTAGTQIPVRGDGGPSNEVGPTSLVTGIDWENAWGALSTYVYQHLNTGGQFRFQVGQALVLTTITAAANQLALALTPGVSGD